MRDDLCDGDLAELLEIVDAAIALLLEDRIDAAAEGRDPLCLWDLVGRDAHVLALAEQRLERALARIACEGEA